MASGDLIYNESVIGTLTTQQRTDLINLLSQIWAGSASSLIAASFERNPDNTVKFMVTGSRTQAPSLIPFGCTITGRVP